MAPPRIEIAGVAYHVNAKAVHGTKLFTDEVDRAVFLALLQAEVKRSDWELLAYSLMTTHFHVLLRLREPTLSSGFQHLNGRYARAYNTRHGRRGALWQRRYFDAMIETESHLYETIRYIARNAPRAGACQAPEDWQWCNYGSAIGAFAPDPIVDEPMLLRLFGPSPSEAREGLRAFVEESDLRQRRGQTYVRHTSDDAAHPTPAT
jgi:REP element-mobilizing transposase RayT